MEDFSDKPPVPETTSVKPIRITPEGMRNMQGAEGAEVTDTSEASPAVTANQPSEQGELSGQGVASIQGNESAPRETFAPPGTGGPEDVALQPRAGEYLTPKAVSSIQGKTQD